MFRNNFCKGASGLAAFLLCVSAVWQPQAVFGQSGESTQELHKRASELVEQLKYTEALPILEKLVISEPDNAETHFYLGFALVAQGNLTKDDTARKALRIRARNAFIKAKELGIQEPVIDALIQSTPSDGSDGAAFSQNAEANKLMQEAEDHFSQGKLDAALDNYQRALKLDAKIYEAALFSGDVHTQRGDFTQAEVWYQRAIAIDPNKETAYRYSATPLMKQRKYDQARDRYIEAYISEPYSNYSVAGLNQWAQTTNTRLAHPDIQIPVSVSLDEKGELKIDLQAGAVLDSKDDGSFAWIFYGATLSSWRKEKFAKTFPREATYRHSLAEEAEALRSVLAVVTADKKVKKLSPSLSKLKKLDDEGLLEAYILLARADQGIMTDHAAYLRQNRERLRRYAVEYIMTGGGSSQSRP